MLFPRTIRRICTYLIEKNENGTLPLCKSHFCPDPRSGEKESAVPSFRASLTVEASLTVPLFLLCIYLFWSFFSAVGWNIRLQHAMDELTGELAQQSYLAEVLAGSDTEDLSDNGLDVGSLLRGAAWRVYVKGRLIHAVGEEALRAARVEHGAVGISVLSSSWNRKGDIHLVVRYRLVFAGIPGLSLKIPVEQASRRRCWTGAEPKTSGNHSSGDSEGEMVYVTETGRVYHRDGNCYHLHVTVRKVSFGAAQAARNQSGGRYKPCEHCAASAAVSGAVYITPQGDRYHVTRDCSGLKRTVRLVSLKSVSLPPCSHCGG